MTTKKKKKEEEEEAVYLTPYGMKLAEILEEMETEHDRNLGLRLYKLGFRAAVGRPPVE